MKLEFSRLISLDRIGPQGLDMTIEATPAECLALAQRMNIPALLSLSATYHLVRESRDEVLAHGALAATVTRTCVVSLDDFDSPVEDVFQIRFVPSGEESDDVDPDTEDEIPFEGNAIDLGEATTEQLGLILDPYPRRPGVELPPVDEENEGTIPHPFAALRRLN